MPYRKLSIRKTKTASGATAVQVVTYRGHQTRVIKHVGSAHTPDELSVLLRSAELIVAENTAQLSLFSEKKTKLLHVDHARSLGTTHHFARLVLQACARHCGLSLKPLFLDLAIMRIIEPSSKKRSLELLKRYFGIRYSNRIYHTFKHFFDEKDVIEKAAVSCAQKMLGDDLFLVLYDVTTLYFETQRTDALRKHGFSKDDKFKQPQIVVGLLVTRQGFPLAHSLFSGKTFEGHTMLPLLQQFTKNHKVETPIVVADVAMLSANNIQSLEALGFSYIVGARLANMSPKEIQTIACQLNHKEGAILRLASKHGDLICSFSEKRYRKDKHEMEQQIEKAKALLAKNEMGRRVKFIKKIKKGAVAFNEDLQQKTELLLGIKGYCTNIPERELSNQTVITYYQDLWRIEQTFRMSKDDLETRPVFHRREKAIQAHALLCFTALMIGKYLEIITGQSLRHIRDLIWEVTETSIEDTLTKELFVFRSPTETVMKSPLGQWIQKWKIPY